MRVSRSTAALTLIIVTFLVLGFTFRKPLSAPFKLGQVTSRQPGEPVALLRFTKNLTVPVALVFLPTVIKDNTGTVIGTLTSAQYCGSNAKIGRVLAQITKGPSAPGAANLLLSDCSSTLDAVVARHKNQTGFSGVLEMHLTWTPWTLTRSVGEVDPVDSSTFSGGQLASLSAFSDQLSMQNMTISTGGGKPESFFLGVAFTPDTITAGFFDSATTPAADWALQSVPVSPVNIPTADIQIGIGHALLNRLAGDYPNGFTYPNQIDGESVTLSNAAELPLSTSTGNSGLRLQADIRLSNPNFCTTTLSTDWYGAPLKLTKATGSTKNGGICKTLAVLIQNEVQHNLQGHLLTSSSAQDFNADIGGRALSVHFSTTYSTADMEYLSMFGNGSINVQ